MKRVLSVFLTAVLLTVGVPNVISAAESYSCAANYYLMNTDMNTYTLDKTERTQADAGAEFSPVVYSYEGFNSPSPKSVTADRERTVNYFYTRKTYTITYTAEGAEDVPEAQEKIHGVNIRLSLLEPQREGMSFTGWLGEDETVYNAGEIISADGDLNLLASWEKKSCVLSFDSKGGSGCDERELSFGDELGELPVPTKNGYSFDGWYYDEALTDEAASTDAISGDVTLRAAWTERALKSLRLKTAPSKTAYFVGDRVDYRGLTLEAVYDNGESLIVSSGYSANVTIIQKSGTTVVTVTYKGKSCKFSVTASEVVLSGIEVTTLPTRTTYYVDDKLDAAGMTVTASYNNGDAKRVTGYDVSYDFSEAGSREIRVSYTEKGVTLSDSFYLTVNEKMTFSVDSAELNAGETVTVPVRVSGAVSLAAYRLTLSYDGEAFENADVSAGESFLDGSFEKSIKNGTIDIIWTGSEAVTSEGVLCTLILMAKDAESGEYTVGLSCESADTLNADYGEVEPVCESGTITLNNASYLDIPRLTAEDVSVVAGNEAVLHVGFTNAKSEAQSVIIRYDGEALTPISVDNGTLGFDGSVMKIDVENGGAFNLTFRASESASGSCALSLSADGAKACEAVLTVKPQATVYADGYSIEDGKLRVPVKIKNNSGLMGYGIELGFDSTALSFNSAEGENLSFRETEGGVKVLWYGTENMISDGVLFTAEFDVLAEGETNLTFSCSPTDTFDEEWNAVELMGESLVFRTSDLLGDADGDGSVNSADAALLRTYLCGGQSPAGDVDMNGDGKIDLKDVVLLEKYIAKTTM